MKSSAHLYSPVSRKKKLYELVVETIQNLLLHEKLGPGDKLPSEQELSRRFDVSRTVIREAIKVLETKRLIATQGGKGYFFTKPTSEPIGEMLKLYLELQGPKDFFKKLIEARKAIEIEIAGLAAERATKKHIRKMEIAIQNMEKNVNLLDGFVVADHNFHLELAKSVDNQIFMIMVEIIGSLCMKLSRIISGKKLARRKAINFHRQILQKIKDKKSGNARELMEKHLGNAYYYTGVISPDKEPLRM